MDKGRYSIIFSSLTGNTKKLAETIRAVLPAEDCDYFGAPETAELYSEMLYVGFWTDKGNADSAALGLLSKLRGKEIFLFGTAGFGGSAAYFRKILDHVKQSVDPSNTVVGEYMCQGKMPQSVRDAATYSREFALSVGTNVITGFSPNAVDMVPGRKPTVLT